MRLGAAPCIDFGMAARTMAFDIKSKKWNTHLLSLCSIPEQKLPRAVSAGTVIGKVSASVSALTGLSTDTIIASGAHDQSCCALGAGVINSGIAMDSLGTTESLLCVHDEADDLRELISNNLSTYPYILPGKQATLAFLSCCGSVVDWFSSSLLAGSETPSQLDKLADAVSEPTGIFVYPYFAGSGTPSLNFSSKGSIINLTLATTAGELYKAILEGTAYEVRRNISLLERTGICVSEYRCIGGGSHSDTWMQIKSNIAGVALTSMKTTQAGCAGAAILAMQGSGFGDACDLSRRFAEIGKTYIPDKETHSLYDELFEEYLSNAH